MDDRVFAVPCMIGAGIIAALHISEGEWFQAALMGVVILLVALYLVVTRPARDADGR